MYDYIHWNSLDKKGPILYDFCHGYSLKTRKKQLWLFYYCVSKLSAIRIVNKLYLQEKSVANSQLKWICFNF